MGNHASFVASGLLALSLSVSSPAQLQPIAKAQSATETVSGMLSQERALAATSDGRLWTLTYWNDGLGNGAASQFVRLHASANNGTTWSIVTTVRTPGPARGSLATGSDGRTLHVAWSALNGNLGYGVYYAPFDTRAMQWGAADYELGKGVDSNTGFHEPVIDVTRRGIVGVAYYTNRQGPWAGQLRVLSNGIWAPVQKVNVDTYGFLCNMTAHGDDFHLAYRTNAGLYGIRYRRFDTNAMAFGAEGEVMVSQVNPLVTTASSGNSIAVAPNGDIYIVYASGAATAGTGVIWLAYAPSGTYAFTNQAKVADDAPLQGGNFVYYHYSVGIGASGVPHVIYSLANETYAKLYWRFSLGGPTLSPQLQIAAGPNDSFQWVVASRLELTKVGVLAALTDRSVQGGQASFLQAPSGVAVWHGAACQGSAAQLPELVTRGLPGLGTQLSLDLAALPASTQGFLALGASDTAYGPLPLPFDLAILGAPGCVLTQDAPVTLGFASGGQGTATLALTVPNNPGLAGVPLYFQALVVAPGANPVGLIVTNGIAAVAR